MAEPTTADSSPDTDRDFDPTADMLVHDYDDENTLAEEEQLSNSDGSNELDELQKEGDMPIEELLAMYGYGNGGALPPSASEKNESRSSSEEEILSNQDLTLDKEEVARDLLQDDEDSNKETTATDLLDCVQIPSSTARLLRSANAEDESDDSDDADYQPVEEGDWKKTIQVGSDFQAPIPDGLHKYGDAPAYENEDRLLWDPHKLAQKEVESYLSQLREQCQQASHGVNAIPQGAHIRDDEQALFLLLQCGHNVEEAVRRRKMQPVPPTDPMSLWSEEECRNFENGLKIYGKDFYLIQQNKVKTRSVGELVQFYYLWKKTERHDMFANKNRLEKKKYALHPGVTDYMERFLDEQEAAATATGQPKERPASPMNSLLYGDSKRQQHETAAKPPTQEEIAAVVEMVQKVVDENAGDLASKLNELAPDLNSATKAVPTLSAASPPNGTPASGEGDGILLGQEASSDGNKRRSIEQPPSTANTDASEPQAKRARLEFENGDDDESAKVPTTQVNCVSSPRSAADKAAARLEHSTNCVANTCGVSAAKAAVEEPGGAGGGGGGGGPAKASVLPSPVSSSSNKSSALGHKTVASDSSSSSSATTTAAVSLSLDSGSNHRSMAAETLAH